MAAGPAALPGRRGAAPGMISTAAAGVIFMLLGTAALLAFAWTLYRQSLVRHWQPVIGTVLASRVETDVDMNSYPVIEYRYTVQGVARQSDRIYPHGVAATTGSYAEALVEKYPAGGKVRVLVNPHNPADTAIIKAFPIWVPLLQLCAGIVFLIMGATIEQWA